MERRSAGAQSGDRVAINLSQRWIEGEFIREDYRPIVGGGVDGTLAEYGVFNAAGTEMAMVPGDRVHALEGTRIEPMPQVYPPRWCASRAVARRECAPGRPPPRLEETRYRAWRT